MTDTPNLALPLIAAAQAQKHVTHNEALLAIDALLQCAVADRDLASPPASPGEGARYIVAAGAGGAWAGQSDSIAFRQDGAWTFRAPRPGFLAFVADEAQLYLYGGAGWVPLASALGAIQNLPRLGIGTAADAANPFSAKLNKALWTARTSAEGGDGSLLYTMNKEVPANDVGLLLQVGFSLRSMIGLFGSNDLTVKATPDGSTFQDAIRVRAASGIVELPRLPRFCAFVNYDAYAAAGSWTTVPLNDSDFNDQGAFNGGAHAFTAPVGGTYAFGASLAWKQNGSNTPTALLARLWKNGAAALNPGPFRAAPLVQGSVALGFSLFARLAAGDTVALQGQFAGTDGYFAQVATRLDGRLVG